MAGVVQQPSRNSDLLWATRETPAVLCVHREYLLLDELDVSRISRAQVVQHLVVVADIAEIELPEVSLPGSASVTLVCRILRAKAAAGTVLRLRHLAPQPVSLPYTWDTLQMERFGRQGGQIHIYAEQLVGTLRVHQPLLLSVSPAPPNPGELPPIGPPPVIFPQGGNLVWFISPYATAAHAGPASLSLHGNPHTRVVDPNEWHSTFFVLVPHSPQIQAFGGPDLLLGTEADLVIAETILGFQTLGRETAMMHAERLNQSLLVLHAAGISPREHTLGQLYRAQALLKLPIERSQSFPEPTLTSVQYDQYGSLIKEMAREAESYDTEFRKMNDVMQQAQATRATQLVTMYQQLSQTERALWSFHSGIRNVEDVRAAKIRLEDWKSQLEKLEAEMEQAKQDMDEGVAEYNDPITANAVFAVLKAVASIGLAMFTGGESLGQSVGEAAAAVNLASGSAGGELQMVIGILQVLVRVMEVLIAFSRYLSALEPSIDQIYQICDTGPMPALPDVGEWASLENGIGEVASTMPKGVADVPTWNAKCKSMAVLCREITMVATYTVLLESNMRVHDIRQNIAEMYVRHLSQMNPDTNLKAFSQLVTLLDVQNNRILLDLLDILELQKGALFHEYLFPVTPISDGWPQMEHVCRMLARHEAEAVAYMSTQLGEPTDFFFIHTVQNIPVGLLENHDAWMFTIPSRPTVFPNTWSRLRIHNVELRFSRSHQPTTDDHQVHILLEGARAFQDLRRNDVVHFNAMVPQMHRSSYNYRSTAGELQTAHEVAGPHVIRMTPFTQWRLRLSDENKGLAFPTASSSNDTTDVSVTFFITRIMRDW